MAPPAEPSPPQSSMRILYLHQYFATPAGSTGTRSYELSRRWVAAGHEVTVLTGRSADPTFERAPAVTTVDGVRVQLIGFRYSQQFGFLRRVIAFVGYAIVAAWKVLVGRRYDVVVATSTPLTIAIPAIVAKRIRRMRVVFEVRDVWPDAAIDAGVLRAKPLILLARLLERGAYRSADAIVALSTGMESRISSRVPLGTPIHMIPNASDLVEFRRDGERRAALRSELGLEGKLVVVYSGTLGIANDVMHVVDIVRRTHSDPRVRWLFVGGGNAAAELVDAVESGELRNCVMMGPVSKTRIIDLLHAADVGLVSFVNTETYFDNSPNKFFDYCAASVPSFFTRSTWLARAIDEYGAGWVDETHSASAVADALLDLADDPERAARAGIAARRMAEEHFDRASLARQYLSVLEAATGSSAK